MTKTALENTTQFIKTLEAETRKYVCCHKHTSAFALRPQQIDDVLYSDTFFSSIRSIRGYKMFQLFCYKKSKLNVLQLMQKETEAPAMYEDTIIDFGAPTKTVTNNANVATGTRWKNDNQKYCIQSGHTVPYMQQQNYAEGEGGNFKHALMKLFHNTPHAPKEYWCYGPSFLDTVRCRLSKSSIND